MKKIVMTMVAACAALTMNAQMYVGGTLGYDNSSRKTATTEVTTNQLTIAPEFGMALDEKLGVGIVLNYENGSTETKPINGATGTTTKPSSTTFGIKPYVRYQMFSAGKCNIFMDGGVNFSIEKDKEVGYDATGKAIDNKAGMNLGLYLAPGISYNVNDQWSIVAKIDDMFAVTYSKGQVADVPNAAKAPTNISAKIASGEFSFGTLRFGVYYNF